MVMVLIVLIVLIALIKVVQMRLMRKKEENGRGMNGHSYIDEWEKENLFRNENDFAPKGTRSPKHFDISMYRYLKKNNRNR